MKNKIKKLENELHEARQLPNNVNNVTALTRKYLSLKPKSWYGPFAIFDLGTYFQIKMHDYKRAEYYFRKASKTQFWKIRSLALNHLGALLYRNRKDSRSLKSAFRIFNQIIKEHPRSSAAKTAQTFISLSEFNQFR